MNTVVNEIRKGFYLDSVALMRLSAEISALGGIEEAVLMTGTPANQQIMKDAGLLTETGEGASANDLIIALRADGKSSANRALAQVQKSLQGNQSTGKAKQTSNYSTLGSAITALPEMNLALISTPGAYASREAHVALDHGINVMIFSDNVSVEKEVALKRKAQDLGLLVMGPDCGTAYINSVPLAFANAVKQGNVSVIAASGTGLQEFSVLLSKLGSGIRHGIGVGGRDMTDDVGALSTLMAIDLLAADEQTEQIVLISKPPGSQTAKLVFDKLANCGKPAIACVFGLKNPTASGIRFTSTLLETAELAAGSDSQEENIEAKAKTLADGLDGRQRRDLKGLFTGGTLCTEAHLVLQSAGIEVSSNAIKNDPSAKQNTKHLLVDLGADEYTLGKPHPMLEPSVRTPYLIDELQNPSNAVIMLDVVLGYGAHSNPASVVAQVVRETLSNADNKPIVIASVCGTEDDPQNYQQQCTELEQNNIILCDCNSEMARLGAAILRQL